MSLRASVSLKKKDGFLTVSDDRKYLFYTPATPPGASPSTTIAIADITNLQQTPASSPKVALKVFVTDENYVFSFTDASDARKEQESITDVLRDAIAASKVGTLNKAAAVRPSTDGESGRPAAMAIAQAASSRATKDSWYDDNKLKTDAKLQRSLIDSNPALRERFEQALRDQPETMTTAQFNAQFWSTRLHLLRAHAIEKDQKQGEYNVLPEIGFVRVRAEKEGDPDIKQLNITAAQIRLIFRQYPVVKEAHNENVPPLDTAQFFTRFFNSRLLKQLKGEKITPQDPADPILDKYLDRRETGPASIAHIPHFIDLEGNEQNHSQRKGNRPDETMRPSSFDKVPILRVLNNLSEKMLSHVAPEDGEAHAPIGLDEATFEQIRLKDLANEDSDNRVVLNIREQQRLHHDSSDSNAIAELQAYARQDPRVVMQTLRQELAPPEGQNDGVEQTHLDVATGYDPNEDSDDDEDEVMTNGYSNGDARVPRVGSKSAMNAATTSVLSMITQKRVAASTDPKALNGLSENTFTTLTITQNTTIEYLHYFWNIFLSGDPSKSAELAQLVSTLDRSIDRIESVGSTAEQEREQYIARIKAQLEQYYQKHGKKRKYDFDTVGGGRKVVDAMIQPTIVALKQAESTYRKALEEQTADSQMAAT